MEDEEILNGLRVLASQVSEPLGIDGKKERSFARPLPDSARLGARFGVQA
jgi:hypothetical protein